MARDEVDVAPQCFFKEADYAMLRMIAEKLPYGVREVAH